LLNERRAAVDRFLDDFDRGGNSLGRACELSSLVGVTENDRENVIEVVRDAAGQRASPSIFCAWTSAVRAFVRVVER